MKIALTGHTTARLRGKEAEVNDWLDNVLTALLIQAQEDEEVEFLCGGADGADFLFGESANWFPQVKLKLCLPIPSYRGKALKDLKRRANSFYYAAEEWKPGLNSKRDKYMVDNCDVLLAIWDGIKQGGTWQTIQYAQKKKKKIIFIDKEIFINELF